MQKVQNLKRVIISSGIGSVMEIYDFCLYAYFAPVLAELFFPARTRFISLLATFSVYAVGYFMRPIGATFFGALGDRLGRKKVLVFSIVLMGIPTFVIGLLPTYSQIGIGAPLLLLLTRIVQGLSVGSEFPGANVFVGEHVHAFHRGLMCSWIMFSIIMGLLLSLGISSLAFAVLSPEDLISWGWRSCFWFGGLIAGVGYYVRCCVPETKLFMDLVKRGEVVKRPISLLVRKHKKMLLQGFGLMVVSSAYMGLVLMYFPTYLSEYFNFPIGKALSMTTYGALFLGVFLPFMGGLSDRWGRKPVLLIGSGAMLLFSYPLFELMTLDNALAVLIAQVALGLFAACSLGTYGSALVELFPVEIRFSGFAFTYGLAFALLTGTAPLIATWLVHWTGDPLSPSFYLSCCALVTFAASCTLERSKPVG